MKGLWGHSKPKAVMFCSLLLQVRTKALFSMHRHFLPVPVWLENDALIVWSLAHQSRGAQLWQALSCMEEHPNEGKALGEEAVSNCRREEWILPLLHMENIPSWKLSCCSLMPDGKIPLGFSDNICSQWVDGTPVRFKLIFWVRKHSETSPCSTRSQCGKGKTPQKDSTEEHSPGGAAVWSSYIPVPGWVSLTP